MNNIGALAIASLLIACGGTGQSDANAQAAAKSVPGNASSGAKEKRYQVAGLQRGMTLTAVNTKLKADGYTLKNDWKKMSFEDGVKVAQAEAMGRTYEYDGAKGATYQQSWANGGETINVSYMPAPGNPLLVSASYTAAGGATSPAEVLATMSKRYGQPVYRARDKYHWCAKPGPKGCFNNQELLTVEQTTININGPTPNDVDMRRLYETEARKLGGTPKAKF